MAYRSAVGKTCVEQTVEKSRFLAYVSHTAGEEEARAFLSEVRAEHPLATHVCWAYIADKTGNEQRFSDDGEPQGTAGMPILNVLKAQKLFETTVAVVRYFGGIKLGAGGLVRAYSSAAAEGCAAAEKCEYDLCQECEAVLDYAQTDGALKFFAENGVNVLSREYGERVRFTAAVKKNGYVSFCVRLKDALCGKVTVNEGREYYAPFPIQAE